MALTKDQAVAKLISGGYRASKVDGIVMIRYAMQDADKLDKIRSGIKKYLAQIGYNASWGLAPSKDADIMDETAQNADNSVPSGAGDDLDNDEDIITGDGEQMSLF